MRTYRAAFVDREREAWQLFSAEDERDARRQAADFCARLRWFSLRSLVEVAAAD